MTVDCMLRAPGLQVLKDRWILSVRFGPSLARCIIRIRATSDQFLDNFGMAIPNCYNERGHTRMVFNFDIDTRSVLEEIVEVVEITICSGFPES